MLIAICDNRKMTAVRPYLSGRIIIIITLFNNIIIIIILFQEDNIFDTDASLTNGPQMQRHTCVWKLLTELKLFTVCTERVRFPYSEHAASELTNPTPLEGGGTIYQGSRPANVTTRSPKMEAKCLLTRSMLIKMYYHFMVCACICTIIFTVSQFHVDVYSLFSLSNCINVFVWHNSSVRKHEHESITTITIQFG